MQSLALEGGFANAPIDSARAFRVIMNVMARPGLIEHISGATPPACVSQAAGVLLLCLCDHETPLYLAPEFDAPDLRDWISFHTGAPIVAPEKAVFALGRWQDLPISDFSIGTPEYPDRSTTVIVETDVLMACGHNLNGPGIKAQATLQLPEADAFQANAALFPLGLDFFFTSGNQIAALPRTTKVS